MVEEVKALKEIGFKSRYIRLTKSFSQGYYVSFYLRSVESMFEAKFNKIPAQLSSFVNINQREPNVSLLKTLKVPVLQ